MQPDRMIQGAQRYALADKSDPFCLARCQTRIQMGLCRALQDVGDGHYDAQEATETRSLPDGRPYVATVYKNMVRPDGHHTGCRRGPWKPIPGPRWP